MRQQIENSANRTRSKFGKAGNFAARGAWGFTLIEMLVVIGIVGVLAALISAAALRARESARAVTCANNLKELGGALTTCLTANNGYFPQAYYDATGSSGQYVITLKSLQGDQPDDLFQYVHPDNLVCRDDHSPVSILARTPTGDAAMLPTSYGYNVSLPLLFRNASRVSQPVNTVTFYEGNAQSLVGTWEYAAGWADSTVSYRHSKQAAFLYLDGHVDSAGAVPEVAFSGGDKWVASSWSAAPSATAAAAPQQDAFCLTVLDNEGNILSGIPVMDCTSQSSSVWQSAGVTGSNGQISTQLTSGNWAFSVEILGDSYSSGWYAVPAGQNLKATVNVSFSTP